MKRALAFYASVAVVIAAAVLLIPHCRTTVETVKPVSSGPESHLLLARISTTSRNVTP
jgi:hypothetical protein